MHISSSYAKILGEKLFHTWEIPRSGSKAEDGERKKEREKERKLVITMAKLRMAHASTHGVHKPSGPITMASYALQRHLGWRPQSRLGQKLNPTLQIAYIYFQTHLLFIFKWTNIRF